MILIFLIKQVGRKFYEYYVIMRSIFKALVMLLNPGKMHGQIQ